MEATYSGSKQTNLAQVGRWYFVDNCRYIIKAEYVNESSSLVRCSSVFEFDGTEAPTTGEWYCKGDYCEFSTWGCSEVEDEELISELEFKVLARRISEMKATFASSPLTACDKGSDGIRARTVPYAKMLLDDYIDTCRYEVRNGREIPAMSLKTLLNGADNWIQYSFGGCSLINDDDIAEYVLSSSQYQKWANTNWEPTTPLLELQAKYLERGYTLLKQVFEIQ